LDKYWDSPEQEIPECEDSDLWRSQSTHKYFKSTNQIRSTKNFDTADQAFSYMASQGNVGVVKEFPGRVMACNYCSAFSLCSQKNQLMAAGYLQT